MNKNKRQKKYYIILYKQTHIITSKIKFSLFSSIKNTIRLIS